MKKEISLTDLLSTCADACSRGCQVIRFVNQKRNNLQKQQQQQQQEHAEGRGSSSFNVVYKVENDPRSALTEADLAAQCVILHCIRAQFGHELNIIGEEDESDSSSNNNIQPDGLKEDEHVFQKYGIPTPSEYAIQTNLCDDDSEDSRSSNFQQAEIMLALEDFTLYIDPMDGTREFVEQRLHNVQCLIGITWKGQPIGGVIGLPFLFNGDDSTSSSCSSSSSGKVHVVIGLNWGKSSFVKCIQVPKQPLSTSTSNIDPKIDSDSSSMGDLWLSIGDCVSSKAKKEALRSNEKVLSVFTSDSKRIHKKYALDYLEQLLSPDQRNKTASSETDTRNKPPILDIFIAGGCGSKILRTTASGLGSNCGNALGVILQGTSSWDTAAPTAIILAAIAASGTVGKVTDMLGGKLVYDATGKKVTNDLGAFVSIGPLAMEYHNKLCEYFRSDGEILESFLKDYWMHANAAGLTRPLIDERLRVLKNAQSEPQAVDFVRGQEGYILTCDQVKSMISKDMIPCNHLNLLGYSIPEKEAIRGTRVNGKIVDKCVMHLFWEDKIICEASTSMPSSVLYERIQSGDDKHFSVQLSLLSTR